jgi:hypothetical protein
MTNNTSAVRPKAPLSPLTIVSSVLFLLFGILTTISAIISSGVYVENLNDWSEYCSDQSPYCVQETQWNTTLLITTIFAPLAAVALALVSLVFRRRWLSSIMGIVLLIVVFVLPVIFQVITWGSVWYWIPTVLSPTSFETFEKPLSLISFIVLLLALLLSIVASVLKPKSLNQIAQPDNEVVSQPAHSPSSSGNQASGQSNLTNLPMFALIGAFIIPLAGIILGHLSLSYMKKGQLSEQNKGMATTGLILGYVFVGLGFLVGLILFIVLIVSAVSGF